jgi:lysophospholipase L1-like esterase
MTNIRVNNILDAGGNSAISFRHLETVINGTGNQSFAAAGRRWAFFGDSITNGSSASNFFFSYTRQCIDACGQLVARRDYIEAGTSGETSAQILARFETTLDTYPDVNAVSILCGTNDSGAAVAPSVYISNVIQMFSIARNRGLPVIICTVPPRGASGTPEQNKLITAYNILLRMYQKDYGYELAEVNSALIDVTTGLMLAAYDSGDGVHPNNLGHIQVGQAVASAMMRVSKLSNKQGIVQSVMPVGMLTPDPLNARATVLSGGWSEWAGGSGTVPVYTMENDVSGVLVAGRWAQMAVNSVSSGTRRLADSHSADFSAGDTILITGKIQIEDLSGTWETNCATDAGNVGITILNQSATAIPGASVFGGRSTGLKDENGIYTFHTFAVQFVVPAGTTTLITWIGLKTPSGSNVKMRVGEFALINMTTLNCALADGQSVVQI